MKHRIHSALLAGALFLMVPFFSAQSKHRLRVLFLGNSYTYVNTLPGLTASIASSFSDTLVVDSYAPGGYTFNNHFNDPFTISKISQGNWDYVVLQAQSQEPSFSPSQVNAQTLPYAIRLDSVIKKYNSCAITMLYETWGRKNGDQSNCNFYPPVCTYTGMQNRLKASYKMFADTVNGVMAPVGEAFRASISANSLLELYQPDESHPSLAGTYLAACVFYECFFHRSVGGSTLNVLSNASEQSFLQLTAHQVVSDSLQIWNLGVHAPWAEINLQSAADPIYQFSSMSTGFAEKWYSGDGATSTASNPVFNYFSGGTYTVSHVVSDDCSKDSANFVLTISDKTGIPSNKEWTSFHIFPQPCQDLLYLQAPLSAAECRILISDFSGKIIADQKYQSPLQLDVLSPGVYHLRINSSGGTYHHKLIKE